MPVEAVPIMFGGNGNVDKAAEDINEVLSGGQYDGHVAIEG